MFIGKWNKSVYLTYISLGFAILGIYLATALGKTHLALMCLMCCGICDMFDGKIARACKRNKEEIAFGIELDSLVDLVCFGVLPIVIYISLGFTEWYNVISFILLGVAGVARLAYFNITLEETNKDQAVKYYSGLPVTFTALIIPLIYLISYLIPTSIHPIYFPIIMFIISILNVLNIKIKKPTTKIYPVFIILAIIVLILFLGVL